MENVTENINEMQRIHEGYGAFFDHLYRQYQRSTSQLHKLNPGDLLYTAIVEQVSRIEFMWLASISSVLAVEVIKNSPILFMNSLHFIDVLMLILWLFYSITTLQHQIIFRNGKCCRTHQWNAKNSWRVRGYFRSPLSPIPKKYQPITWTQSRRPALLRRCRVAEYLRLFGQNQKRPRVTCHVFHL